MPTFKYIARDASGKRVDGTLEAADRNNAMLMLQQMDRTPLSLNQTGGDLSKAGFTRPRFNFKLSSGRIGRMKPRAMLLFSREMADLLASLNHLVAQTGNNCLISGFGIAFGQCVECTPQSHAGSKKISHLTAEQ